MDDFYDGKGGRWVTQCGPLIGLLTLPLTAGEVLIRTSGLSPSQSIVLNHVRDSQIFFQSCYSEKNHNIFPRSVINAQQSQQYDQSFHSTFDHW